MDQIIVKNGEYLLDPIVASKIADFELKIKALKEAEDDLKASILAEMEAKNVIKLQTDDMTITYIAQTDRETFDSKTFRKDNPDLYDSYIKMTPVKASIRIKVVE